MVSTPRPDPSYRIDRLSPGIIYVVALTHYIIRSIGQVAKYVIHCVGKIIVFPPWISIVPSKPASSIELRELTTCHG